MYLIKRQSNYNLIIALSAIRDSYNYKEAPPTTSASHDKEYQNNIIPRDLKSSTSTRTMSLGKITGGLATLNDMKTKRLMKGNFSAS